MNKDLINNLVSQYMTTQLITFSPDTDIKDALFSIINNKISGAPVVNNLGDLVGIISEKDCLRLLIGPDYYNEPGKLGKVKDFMSTKVETLNSNQTVFDAAHAFINSNFRRFPVTENNKLIGQISRRDILRAVEEIESPSEKPIPSSWKGREPQ